MIFRVYNFDFDYINEHILWYSDYTNLPIFPLFPLIQR